MNSIPAKSSKHTPGILYSMLDVELQRYATVLDLPCGKGALASRLLSSEKNYKVYGGDILPICRAEGVHFRIINMNQKLPFEEGFFDAVVCGDGLAHLERPFDFVREVHRVLKTEGVFCVSTPNLSSLRSRWRFFTTGFHNKRKVPFNEQNWDPEHIVNALDFPDLRYLFHSNGFNIEVIKTNQYKVSTCFYILFLPLVFLLTLFSFVKESLQSHRSKDDKFLYLSVFKQIFKKEILFGETLILKLRKS